MKRLSLSILKNNKLFSVSLLFIYVIVTVILVMLTFFYPSVQASVDTFLDEYGLADVTIVTQKTFRESSACLTKLEGVEAVDATLAVEGKTTLSSGDIVTLRYSNIPESGKCKYYSTATKTDVVLNDQSVLISSKFAEKNQVAIGDDLCVSVNGETVSLKVTDLVSCPDTIYVARDVNSWFDDTQYGFVYVSSALMESSFHTGNIANIFTLWLAEDADRDAVLANAQDALSSAGVSVVSAALSEDSTVYYQIHSTLDGTKAVVTYLPILIFIMGILFCGFFVYQIICSSNKTIGILQSMGMSTGRICLIFIRYSVWICTVALVFGFALGVPVLYLFLNVYKNLFVIPRIVWAGNVQQLLFVVLAVYAISVLSCVVCVRAISASDPAVLLAGNTGTKSSKIPNYLRKWKLGAYEKITVGSLLRNKKRLAVMVLCNVACLLLTFLSLSVLSSKMSGMNFMLNERFNYDFIVITEDAETMEDVSALSCVEKSEQVASAVFDYEGEYLRIEALEDSPELTAVVSPDGEALTVPEDGIILEEGFARRHNLSAGDTLSINGTSITVSAICREYFYSTQYVSFATAARLGVTSANALYVRLEDGATTFKEQLSTMDDVACFYAIEQRRTSAIESMQAMDAPCYLFVVFGILIGLVIVSNINIHSIQQRKKEFATLKVLGASEAEFNRMFLLEVFVQYVLSLVPGILISIPAAHWILRKMSSMSMEFVVVHVLQIALVSAAAVLLYLLLGLISAKKTVERLDLPEILAKR